MDKRIPKIIVDAHEDIAYNALHGRDYVRAAWEKRRLEAGKDQRGGTATIGLPDALLGRVGIVFATIYAEPFIPNAPDWLPVSEWAYKTPQEAYRAGMKQLDIYHRLEEENQAIRIIRTQGDLDEVLASWDDGTEIGDHRVGLVMLMEGADPIVEPKQAEEWYEKDVRLIGPAWMATRYTAGSDAPGPLTDLGRELLEVMADLGMILDTSHMAEEAFYEAVDRYEGTIIASHSNPRRRSDIARHLSDEMIARLAEREGVMGMVMYNRFIDPEWSKDDAKSAITLEHVAEMVDYVCQLTGSAEYVGIGTDFDGGFGVESIPQELDTVGDLWQVAGALEARGYEQDHIDGIMAGNFLRVLRRGLPT